MSTEFDPTRIPVGDRSGLAGAVRSAAERLRAGGVVLYPTETFYALGADPRSPEGCAAVFRWKGREASLRLPWIAADREQVEAVCRLSEAAAALAERYWPGPLTLVLPLRDREDTVAVRVSSHPVARALAAALGHPVISTSANRSGALPARTAAAAVASLGEAAAAPPAILDGGTTPGGAPSVIVDATGTPFRALRGSLDSLSDSPSESPSDSLSPDSGVPGR